ncbi:hypothetical protein ACFFLS_11925 [Flavobacterium procerum]|uniref:DUF4852 domain-containing protein n=1 Tax=Flavobacterium procerum TaxID=1455569 RepID=A0ABV6BQM7_9FLAO
MNKVSTFLLRAFCLILVFIPKILISQNVQPLGIPTGIYEIGPTGTSQLKTYCLDKSITTYEGTSYDRVALGSDQIIMIGNQRYSVNDALSKNLISFTYSHSDSGIMYMLVKNNTKEKVRLIVDKDFVLSDNKSTNVLKETTGLNHSPTDLQIPKQQYIWFSQSYKDYLYNYKDILLKIKIIHENESLKLDDYLKRRRDFLNSNGIKDQTLVDKREHGEIYDYALLNLLSSKLIMQEIMESTSRNVFYLRQFTKDGLSYYCLDNGSVAPLLTKSLSDLQSIINNEKNAYVLIDETFPVDKKNALITNLQLSKITLVENVVLSKVDLLRPLTFNSPEIKTVREVEKIYYSDNYKFEVSYNVGYRDEEAIVTSKNKSVLEKIRAVFAKLVGTESQKSITDTYQEAKLVAKKAFPGRAIKAKLTANYSSMHISQNSSENRVNNIEFYVYN